MSDLTDFLLARIAEDESVARVESLPPGSHRSHGSDPQGTVDLACPACRALTLNFWPRPRVLAEIEAKRLIVHLVGSPDPHTVDETAAGECNECAVLYVMARVYSDHPAYRPEWRA